ncbi:MAG TPA: MauE/DoxX family redox-associated membrane protein [Oceanobacillus sp.]|nr:MauE/DoxX family redox-associated membrane protein [Oceanobacillus sp.]
MNLSTTIPRQHPLSSLLATVNWMVVFRWLVVGCLGATIWVTWSLWQVRESPPMLPALPLPRVDMGVILLIALAVVLVKPLIGTTLFSLTLLYAILIDQTRLQPEFVSLALVLWGTLPYTNARFIGRAHLISLWLWAGINKFLSPDFLRSTGPSLFNTLMPNAPDWLRANSGYLIAGAELSIGLLAIFPRTRKLAALLAFGVHMTIFLILSPFGRDWNIAVWPWNIALAFAGFALIAPWRESLWRMVRLCRPLTCLLAVFILISPVGFYFGMIDAYLAHNLYSSNVPTASRTPPTWRLFNVPFPPEHRLFEQHFRLTCNPGDTLTIRDERWWYQQQGLERRTLECEAQP